MLLVILSQNYNKSLNLLVSSKGPKSITGYQKLIFQDSEQLYI